MSSSSRSNKSSASLDKKDTVEVLKKLNQELQKENAALSKELTEIKLLHQQMLHEGASENFSERRVNILKSQIFQLERQVVLLSETVSGYATTHSELHSMLETLTSKLSAGNHSSKDLTEMARQMQAKLLKSNRRTAESNAIPLMSATDFLTATATSWTGTGPTASLGKVSEERDTATVLDICMGRTDHINFKHVAQLESKLAKLFGELVKLQSSLQTTPPTSLPSLLQPMRDHSSDHMTSCCKMISECCNDLLCLSFLLPTFPWPQAPKCKQLHLELNSGAIMKRMPPAVRTRKEVREAVERTCNCFVYISDMNGRKCEALEEELGYHKSVYALQVGYVESLFDAMRKGYQTFESSAQDLICKPLQEVLACYETLRSTASDTALREFLTQVQVNATQLKAAVGSLSCSEGHPQEQAKGVEALSEFGANFFKALSTLESDCSRKRSVALREAAKEQK